MYSNWGYNSSKIIGACKRKSGAVAWWTRVIHDSNPKDESGALPGLIEDYQFRVELISSLDEDELEVKIKVGPVNSLNSFADTPEPKAQYECELSSGAVLFYEDNSSVRSYKY